MRFNSDARQDEFACRMLNFKTNGTSVDVGSCGPVASNNTFAMESLGWRGICIEMEPSYAHQYSVRNAKLITADATQIDYKAVFEENSFPKIIDYLSLDVDTASLTVLGRLPFDEYKFRVITIEHDSYLYGDQYKGPQRQILSAHGYRLLCADVKVQQPGFYRPDCPFEDWWVMPSEFDEELMARIQSNALYPSEIMAKF